MGCDPDNGPYVIEALSDRLDGYSLFSGGLRGLPPAEIAAMAPVAAAFLDESTCAAASGLSADTMDNLRRVLANAKP